MANVGQNTFTVTNGGQFTEFGFSRVPLKGCHHHHLGMEISTPTSDTTDSRRAYTMVGILDLKHLGPQIIDSYALHHTMDFMQDMVSNIGISDTTRIGGMHTETRLTFTTSLGTELSSLDKTVTPTATDYTSRQYRLISFSSSQGSAWWTDGANIASGGGAGAAVTTGVYRSIAPFDGTVQNVFTKPLVVGPQLVAFIEIDIDMRGNPIRLSTDSLTAIQVDMDLFTCDFKMTAEDIWFSRKIFNQSVTNRLMYFRFVQE